MKFRKKDWKLPTWYLLGVFLVNILSFGIYFLVLRVTNLFVGGILNLVNLCITIAWFIINIVLLINITKKKMPGLNFIFPIYFIILDIYVLALYYLAWFRDIYIPGSFTNFLTYASTIFEIAFASLFLYIRFGLKRHPKHKTK